MSINIEYKIKPYFTKDTLMSFLCKDINYIDTDKAKSYVEGYLSKIPGKYCILDAVGVAAHKGTACLTVKIGK